MSEEIGAIQDRGAAVHEAGSVLRGAPIDDRAAWLASAANLLSHEAAHQTQVLARSTGLSAPMVAWAMRTTLRTVEQDALRSLAARASGPQATPIAMLALILAGNVFTAAVRAVVVPLLLGVPVLVKASSRQTIFPLLLKDAVRRADPALGAALDVVVFEGGDLEREAALIAPAEAVAVYGSDQTVASVGARCGDKTLIAHGHGISAAYCSAEALHEARIADTVADLALDICAYDQRGCLSPQVVYVQTTKRCPVLCFAERLATEGLEPMSRTLPRGPLPPSVGAAQEQWRGMAEVEGTLLRGKAYAVCIRSVGSVRWSPGYRNVTLIAVKDAAEALEAMGPFAASLKCIGTDAVSRAEVESVLARSNALQAYACGLGQMQCPGLDAPADGKPIWYGLLRPHTPMKRR